MTDIGKLTYSLSLDTSRFTKQLKKFNKIASKRGRKTGKELGEEITQGARKELTHLDTVIAGFFEKIGISMMETLTNAFRSVGSAISGTISGAYELEKSMKTIQGKAQASKKEIDSLKSSIISLSGDSAKTAQEIATAGEKMAQFGFSTKETEAVMKGISQTSTATGESMEKVARALNSATQGFDEYNKSQEDAIELGDRFTAIANNANVTIENLRMGLSKYSAVANDANQSFKDTAAAFAVLRDTGIQAEQAGTTVRVVLQRLQSPSKKAREALNELNVELRNSEGQMKSLPKMLEEFDKALQGVGKEKADLLLKQIFGSQGLTGFKALMSEAEGRYKELRKTIENSQNVAAETANTMRTEWESFQSTVDALGKRIGTSVLPVINSVLGLINDIYAGIKKVDITFKPITEAVKELGIGFQVSEESAKSLGKSIGQDINSAIEFTANIISRVNEFWKENQSTINAIGKFISNSFQGAVENVVNLVSRLQNFWKQNKEELKEIWKQIATKIKNAVVGVVSTVTDWIANLKEAKGSFMEQKGLLNSIWDLIKAGYNLWNSVLDVIKFIGTYLKVVIENLGRFINFLAQIITGTNNAADAWSLIGDWLQKLIDWLADFINDTSDLISLVAKHLTKAWKTAGDWLERAAKWVDEQLKSGGELVNKVGDELTGAWETVTGWVDSVIDKLGVVGDWITKIASNIKNSVGNAISGALDLFQSGLNAVWNNIPAPIRTAIKKGYQGAKSVLSGGGGGGDSSSNVNLMGSRDYLAPLAELAKKHNLRVISGHRPGSTTAAGKPDYHSKRQALDFRGSKQNMAAFTRAASQMFPNLHSLIYSGAKNSQLYKGQRGYRFNKNIVNSHYDHVHISAKPGQVSGSGGGNTANINAGRISGVFDVQKQAADAAKSAKDEVIKQIQNDSSSTSASSSISSSSTSSSSSQDDSKDSKDSKDSVTSSNAITKHDLENYFQGGAVPDPRNNRDFQKAFRAATGKELNDYKTSPVTEAKRELAQEKQSDLQNKADNINRKTQEIEARIERVNKQINDLKAARSTKKQRGGDYQDDKDFTARIQELQEYRDEQKKLLEVERKLADTKMGEVLQKSLKDGTEFARGFSDQLNQLNRDFSDLSFSEKYQNKLKDMENRFDELKDKISGLIEEQRKVLEVDPSNQQAKRNLENLKEMGKVLDKKQAQAKEFIRNNHIADALEKGTEHVTTFSDKMNELNREFSDFSDHEKLQNKLADIEDRFDSMKQTIDELIEAQRKVLEVDPGNAEALRNIKMLGQQKKELSKKEAEAKKYTRNKHFEEAAEGNAPEYRQNRLDAYSRQRDLNKSLMDAQMAGVEGEYRRSQANYELEKRKLRMETQSRISEAKTNPNLSDSERENIVNQLERLEEIKLKNLQEDVKTLGEDLNNAFTGAVQEGLKGLITGTKTLGEALTGVLDKLTEFALNKAFQGLFGGGLGTGGGGVLGAAMGVATGGLFGGGGNPLNGGNIYPKLGFASGGLVPDVNSGKRNQKGDSVPAMLTPGEYVLNRQDTSKLFGQGSISAGEVAGFNGGGKVNSAAGSGNTFHFSTNVTLEGDRKGMNRAEQQQLQKNVSSVVKQEIQRQQQPGGLLS